jgi:hypothetical protein
MYCDVRLFPGAARRALRLDLPGAQVEAILRDHDPVLRPHVAVPLDSGPRRRHRARPRQPLATRPPEEAGDPYLSRLSARARARQWASPGQRAAGPPPGGTAAYWRP